MKSSLLLKNILRSASFAFTTYEVTQKKSHLNTTLEKIDNTSSVFSSEKDDSIRSIALKHTVGGLPARQKSIPTVFSQMASALLPVTFCESIPNPAVPDYLKVGVIGGMGPAVSADFHKFFVQIQGMLGAEKDSDHIVVLLEDDPTIQDRTRYLLHGGPDPKPGLQMHLNRFKDNSMRMDIAAAVCNTFHAPKIYGELQKANPDMPILSLVEATEIFIKTNYPNKKVGLLATDGTIETNIYGNEKKIIPDNEIQQKVMMAIYAIKAGYHEKKLSTFTQRKTLLDILRQHPNTAAIVKDLKPEDMRMPQEWLREAADSLQKKGAEVIIMGCTEIPLALHAKDSNIPLIDTIKVLALGLVLTARYPKLRDYAKNYRGKEEWNDTNVLTRAYAMLATEMDLSCYPEEAKERLSVFMGKETLTKKEEVDPLSFLPPDLMEILRKEQELYGQHQKTLEVLLESRNIGGNAGRSPSTIVANVSSASETIEKKPSHNNNKM